MANLGRRKAIEGSGCWVWTGTVRPDGYGKITIPGTGRTTTTHRAAAFVFGLIDALDSRKVVATSKSCVQGCFNPAHMKVYKDRAAFAREAGHRPRGATNGRSKLPEEMAGLAVALCAEGRLTDEEVAAELNRRLGRDVVSTRMVTLLRTKKSWRHLWLPPTPAPATS